MTENNQDLIKRQVQQILTRKFFEIKPKKQKKQIVKNQMQEPTLIESRPDVLKFCNDYLNKFQFNKDANVQQEKQAPTIKKTSNPHVTQSAFSSTNREYHFQRSLKTIKSQIPIAEIYNVKHSYVEPTAPQPIIKLESAVVKGMKDWNQKQQSPQICKHLKRVIKPLYGMDWTKRLNYETVFTSLTHHQVENELGNQLYLADDLMEPQRAEQQRYRIECNVPKFFKLASRQTHCQAQRPLTAKKSASQKPGFFKCPSMIGRPQDFWCSENLRYKALQAERDKNQEVEIESSMRVPQKHSYFKETEKTTDMEPQDMGRDLWPLTCVNNKDFYDFDLVSPSRSAKLDFSTMVLPRRTVTKNEFTFMTDIAPVSEVMKPRKDLSELAFGQRHGREDNLMYRQTEAGRVHRNMVKMCKTQQNLKCSDYDFKRDFLQIK